jgi:hypothetical protein
MDFQNVGQDMTVKKDGIAVGNIINYNLETGEATLEILPEYAEEIWKEIAVPYIGTSSRQYYSDEKIDNMIDEYFTDDGSYMPPVFPTNDFFNPDDDIDFFNPIVENSNIKYEDRNIMSDEDFDKSLKISVKMVAAKNK